MIPHTITTAIRHTISLALRHKISLAIRHIVTIAIFFFATQLSYAQTLTIEDCINMALGSNNAIKASEFQTRQAKSMVKSLKANYFPDFSLSATGIYSNARGSYNIEGGNLPVFNIDAAGAPSPTGGFAYFPGIGLDYKVGPMFSAGLEVTQPLYMGGRIRSSVAVASHKSEAAEAMLQMTRHEVIESVTNAYADVVKAEQLLRVANEYRNVILELQANVQSAINHGMRHNNDGLKVAVRLNEADLAILKAKNGIRLAKMNLCRLTGLSMLDDIEVIQNFPEVTMPGSIDDNSTIYDRPEWRALQSESNSIKSQIGLARSEMLPQIGLMATYAYNYGFELNHTTLFNRGAFAVMLNVSVPLYHFGGRSAKVDAAREQWRKSQAEMHDKEQLLLLDLHKSYSNLEEAHAAVNLSVTSVEQAAENMRLSRVMFDNGMETLSDYLEAQLLWSRANQQHVEAAFNLYIAHIAYLRASAGL